MGPYCKSIFSNVIILIMLFGLVACGSSSKKPTTIGSKIIVKGKVSFDLIPIEGKELDLNNITQSPARGIVVQAVNTYGKIIANGTTNDNGDYSLSVNQNIDVKIRVSAKMLMSRDASWDVKLSDNTKIIANRHPLYISESSIFLTSEDVTKNIHLPTGRNGRNGGVKSAAPFAILDAIYEAIQTVVSADPDVKFPPLEIHWSPENNSSQTAQNSYWSDGAIGTSFYTVVDENNTGYYPLPLQIGQYRDKIYLLGDESSDADEFDRHVITHEWGHYFEQNLSRSDSMGGYHRISEKLDPNIAFSEGWSNSFAAIVTSNPIYLDTSANSGSTTFNIESSVLGPDGWYSERSIQEIIYDIYDSNSDYGDTISLGFEPIYSVLTSNDFMQNEYQTTIFSFAQILKNQQPDEVSWVLDGLMESQLIFGKGFEGEGEINDGGITSALPVYKTVSANNGAIELCNTRINISETPNKLGNINYVIFEPEVAGDFKVSVISKGEEEEHEDEDPIYFNLSIIKSGNEIAVYNNSNNQDKYLSSFMSAEKHIIKVSIWDPDETEDSKSDSNNEAEANAEEYCFDLQVTTN